jgi:hypothetical protein
MSTAVEIFPVSSGGRPGAYILEYFACSKNLKETARRVSLPNEKLKLFCPLVRRLRDQAPHADLRMRGANTL